MPSACVTRRTSRLKCGTLASVRCCSRLHWRGLCWLLVPLRFVHRSRCLLPLPTEKRLEEEVQRGSVVCLQEVCTSWGGRLLGFFARNQYMFVHTNYSGDRMGVGIAYPLGAFQLLEADLPRIAGTKQWPPQPRPSTVRALLDFALAVPVGAWTGATGRLRAKTPKAIKSAVSSVVGTVSGVIARVCARRQVSGAPWGGDPSADVWQAAQRRQNRAAMLRLQHIATGVEFVVGTYHMPCAFRTPAMMVIHAALVGQKVTRYRATWRRAGCVLV